MKLIIDDKEFIQVFKVLMIEGFEAFKKETKVTLPTEPNKKLFTFVQNYLSEEENYFENVITNVLSYKDGIILFQDMESGRTIPRNLWSLKTNFNILMSNNDDYIFYALISLGKSPQSFDTKKEVFVTMLKACILGIKSVIPDNA